MTNRKKPEDLRSHRWLGVTDLRSFGHRSRLRQIGYDADDWAGKPVIGIINTWSEINPCHAHLRARAENVKRGVLQAGGFPIELPAMSLSETVREADDHDVPQLPRHGDRGAAAQPSDRRRGADGRLRQDHARPGHGRDQHGHSGDLHSGRPDAARQLARQVRSAPAPTSGNTGPRSAPATSPTSDWDEIEGGIARSFGTCMVMGTAATMMAITEALGPGAARRVVDPGGRRQSSAHVRRRRPPHRRHGVGGSDAGQDPDAGRVRQRHQGAHGDGRLDQRHHPCGGDGAARRHPGRHGDVRPALAADSGARQRAAVGQIPDGGFLLRRRPARADAESAREARSVLHDRHRQDHRREHRGRQGPSSPT